jgi:stage II sporulation protein M
MSDTQHETEAEAEPEPETDTEAGEDVTQGSWSTLAGRLRLARWGGRYFAAATIVFVLGVGIGAGLVQVVSIDALSEFAAGQSASLFPGRFTVRVILVNNLIALGVVLAGVISFGVLSVLSLLFNGVIIGILLGATIGVDGASPLVVAALIVPHGIIELPAFWLAGAIGLRVAHRLIRYLRGKDARVLTRAEVLEVIVLVVLAAVMIVVAAWIEVNITPVIGERVGASV